MAWIVADGFDYYSTAADLARSVWDSYGPGTNGFQAGRFGTGQALKAAATPGIYFTKTIPSNESTLYVAMAYYRYAALSGTSPEYYITYRDGATAQCTIVFESSGNIVLKSGIQTGTVLATYSAAFAQDVWTHFQVKVVIDGSAGELRVRKNGAVSDTFVATGLNSRGGTANNYANVIVFGGAAANLNQVADDLLFFSGSGAAPNTWVGDCRAICVPAMADTAQKQFAPIPAATGTVAGGSSSSNVSYASDTVRFTGFTPTRSGVVTKATLTLGALTGNMQAALYDSTGSAGAPGALLGTSAVVTNPSGATDFTFAAGPALAQGITYYFALNHNISLPVFASSSTGAYYTQSRTYASGFPNPATPTGATAQPYSLLTLSGNVYSVSEALANGDTDYVASSNVNDEDLYTVGPLPVTPFAILGVVSKVYIRKSDAGTRQGQVRVKSGATEVAGVDTAVSSTWTYLARVDAVDPNTGATWTLAALTALQIGQRVTL